MNQMHILIVGKFLACNKKETLKDVLLLENNSLQSDNKDKECLCCAAPHSSPVFI